MASASASTPISSGGSDVAVDRSSMSVEEATKAIQAYLRPDERCAVAVPARIIKGDKKRPRILAIVYSNKSPNESGLFLFKQRKQGDKIVVTLVLPIYHDTMFTVVSLEEAAELYDGDLFKGDQQPLLRFGFNDQELLAQVDSIGLIETLQLQFREAVNLSVVNEDIDSLREGDSPAVVNSNDNKETSHAWIKAYFNAATEPSEDLQRMNTEDGVIADLSTSNSTSNPFVNLAMFQTPAATGVTSFKQVKEQWIKKQLALREKEFTEYKKLSIFVGTWNVNGKYATESLSPWLSPEELEPDLYVIGFQELDLSASALVLDNSSREEEWTRVIDQGLKSRKKYKKIVSKQLVGMLIILYVKTDHIPFIKDVATDSTGTGLMGMMGNKGGVAIRLKIYDSNLVFVNTHLAADTKEVERRNLDFREVSRKITFSYPGDSPTDPPKLYSISDCDYLIWLGDLNYRIPLPDADVRAMMEQKKYKKLLKYDQLNIEKKAGRVFNGFEEGEINFQPSYKYDPGTDNFDSSEKRRSPAWCDRILWRSGDKLNQLTYKVHMELRASDHKPVSSIFEAYKVKVFLKEKLNETQLSIVRDLDKFENEVMPDATISDNVLNFGQVKYLQPQTKTLTLENVGQVLVQFKFIPKLQEENVCKPWLWIQPAVGMLTPGEKIDLSFTLLVNNRSAPALNRRAETIDDILILHLENGKDVFISVTGDYQLTCFSTPLDTLTKLKAPVRSKQPPASSDAPQMSVPKELWRIVDYIYNKGLHEPDLFMNTGDLSEMDMIRDCLDTGEPFTLSDRSPTANHSMAETLIRFLEALPEPVIPFAQYQRCVDAYQTYQLAKQALAQLPLVHYQVFVYLMAFLREVLANTATNRSNPDEIATIFSAVLLRSPKQVAEKYTTIVQKKKASFLLHFFNIGTETS